MVTVHELRQQMTEIIERFRLWKLRVISAVAFVTLLLIARSHTTQHREIRYMRNSLSNFYKEFDIGMLKNPKEMQAMMQRISDMSGPISKIEEMHQFSNAIDKKIEILQNYEHDKTGRADLANWSSGGKIAGIGTDTKTFYSCSVFFKLLGCPNKIHGPEKAIQPSMHPGECFAFKGQQGSVIIRLIRKTTVDSITVEHISKQISPTSTVTEAPRKFSVSGLNSQYETPFKLGTFTFEANKTSIQAFDVPKRSPTPHQYVKFDFHENNGNAKKTCVYRLRVHGVAE